MSVYHLSEQARTIVARLAAADEIATAAGGEVTPDVAEVMLLAEDAHALLVRNLEKPWAAEVLRELAATADAAREAARRQQEHARRCEARIGRARDQVREAMTVAGLARVGALSIRKSGGAAPVHVDEDATYDEWPVGCVRVKVEPDLRAVREALARGESVPGAHIGERSLYLVVGAA